MCLGRLNKQTSLARHIVGKLESNKNKEKNLEGNQKKKKQITQKVLAIRKETRNSNSRGQKTVKSVSQKTALR